MGEVYKARDTRLERTVAIKVLPAHLSSSAEIRQRFEREARMISQLSHPHICALYDVGNQDGVEYLVMEYLQGETLAERLSRGALPFEQTRRLGVEIAGALDSAHRQGVVHRDLKPGNIMLTLSGVKLLDFGLAKVLHSQEAVENVSSLPTTAKDITREGTILGTLAYMAPEQLEGKNADARTDIFALGAVLYEMAAGRKAFSGQSQASLISAIMKEEPPPISTIEALTPPAFDRLVSTCLAKDPAARWQCTGDVRLELSWIPRGATPETMQTFPARARKWWLAGAVALILAAASLAGVLARRVRPSVPGAPVRFGLPAPSGTRLRWGHPWSIFEISPDGRRLAFVAHGSAGRDSLWIRSLSEASAASLPGTEGAQNPFWSPDSRFVAFFAEGKLKKIDVSGGPPLALCDVPPGFPFGTWGSQHTILLADAAGASLSLVGDAGGAPKIVLKPEQSRQETTLGWPSFLPDGRHFLYVVRATTEKRTGVRLGNIDGSSEPLVKNCSRAQYIPGESAGRPGYLLYARDGSLLAQPFDSRKMRLVGDAEPTGQEIWQHALIGDGAFSASDDGVLAFRGNASPARLVWLDRAGRETGSLESPAGFDSVSLSPDSRRVIVNKINPRTGARELWIGDVARSMLTKLDLGEDEYLPPVWSPDGARLALSVGSLAHPPVLSLLSLRGGRSPEPILPPGPIQFAESWSPDGRFLLYVIRSGAQMGIWVVNVEGERHPRLLLTGVFDPYPLTQFSPDGRWIAYSSAESGRREIYVTTFPDPGERVRVSTSGGYRPRWRRDGRELFYISDENEMIATPIRLGLEAQVGTPQRLFRLSPGSLRDYDVTGDGQRFLAIVDVPVPDADDIAITLNWTSLLKR
jgi:Tol biopolymer transport system component